MNVELDYLPIQVDILNDIETSGHKYYLIQKGRRFGLTHGLGKAMVEWGLEGKKILWGDTITGNIKRYFERYIKPDLEKNGIDYHWDGQEKKLQFKSGLKGWVDFRSADRPENWEGFGYDIIFLNEAGIILKNKDLYTNTVLPMLLDNPKSVLIAGGVPKGMYLKNGQEHPFYTLCKRGAEDPLKYKVYRFSSYDNPMLSTTDIQELEGEIALLSPDSVRQEIYGEFIEKSGDVPFATHFNTDMVQDVSMQGDMRVIVSIDFNNSPFCLSFYHVYNNQGKVYIDCFDSWSLDRSSTPEVINKLKNDPVYSKKLSNCLITGDYSGSHGSTAYKENRSHFDNIRKELRLLQSQIRIKPNPRHRKSRDDVNYAMYHSEDFIFRFDKTKCEKLERDLKIVQYDETKEQIIKFNRTDVAQQADLLDTFRSLVDNFVLPYIDRHRKYGKV